MSVEASLVLPLVLVIIVFLLYLGFYYYDSCLLKQDNYRLLIRMQEKKWVEDDEIIQMFSQEENEWYYDKYVLYSHEPRELKISGNKITVFQKGNINVPSFSFISNEKRTWEIEDSAQGNRYDVVRILRDLRKAEGK